MTAQILERARTASPPYPQTSDARSDLPDPFLGRRVRESFQRQRFMRHLGARLTDVLPGRVELQLDFRDALTQQHGLVHGGVIATLADVAGGYAAYSVLKPGVSNVTVEFKLSLLAQADGRTLVARGSVLRAGRTLTVCRTDVYSRRGDEEALCATALATFLSLPGIGERPTPEESR